MIMNKTFPLSLIAFLFLCSCKKNIEPSKQVAEVQSQVALSGDITPQTDEVNTVTGSWDEFTYFYNYPEIVGYYGDWQDPLTGITYPYNTTYEVMGHFERRDYLPLRGNNLMVKINFYYLSDLNFQSCFKVTALGNTFFNIEGSRLGEITDKSIQAHFQHLPTTNYDVIQWSASASERRTLLVSTNGSIKLIGGANAELIELGNEYELGFIVQSASNQIGSFTYSGTCRVAKGQGGPTSGTNFPKFTFIAQGINYGIQKN